MISRTAEEHREALLTIIKNSGQFDEDGLVHVKTTLDAHLENPEEAIWFTAIDDVPVGVAYCAPEPVTSGTWNLLMLWMKDGYEGRGFGKELVSHVENEIRNRQARLLIVETSQLPDFSSARAFYEKCGFNLEAEVKDFFAAGDNKLIYTKAVQKN